MFHTLERYLRRPKYIKLYPIIKVNQSKQIGIINIEFHYFNNIKDYPEIINENKIVESFINNIFKDVALYAIEKTKLSGTIFKENLVNNCINDEIRQLVDKELLLYDFANDIWYFFPKIRGELNAM